MKLVISYMSMLSEAGKSPWDESKISEDVLLGFEQASGVRLERDTNGKPTVRLTKSIFDYASPEQEQFVRALRTFRLAAASGFPVGVYDAQDIESAELLFASVPQTERGISIGPYPGTLLYGGTPPTFKGPDLLGIVDVKSQPKVWKMRPEVSESFQ